MRQISVITPAVLSFENEPVNGYVVEVSSYFNHNRDFFFEQEMIKKNTLRVVKPMVSLTFIKENEESELWQEGFTYELTGKAFGLFKSGGTHYIHILKVDHENKIITTTEKNSIAKIWDHSLEFKAIGENTTKYTDRIVLYSGWSTRVFASYLTLFYKSRHRNWNRILNALASGKTVN